MDLISSPSDEFTQHDCRIKSMRMENFRRLAGEQNYGCEWQLCYFLLREFTHCQQIKLWTHFPVYIKKTWLPYIIFFLLWVQHLVTPQKPHSMQQQQQQILIIFYFTYFTLYLIVFAHNLIFSYLTVLLVDSSNRGGDTAQKQRIHAEDEAL